jgi:hypothetical protein
MRCPNPRGLAERGTRQTRKKHFPARRTWLILLCLLALPVAVDGKTVTVDDKPTSVQPASGEGPFIVNFTTLGINQTEPVAIADSSELGLSSSILTATNAKGEGLLHNLTGRCLGWYILDRDEKAYEYHGHCNYTDGDGDVVYEKADFDRQALGPVYIGTGKWLGGTGKYAELSGVFEIRVRPLKPSLDGYSQGIGTKQGRYRLPPVTSK